MANYGQSPSEGARLCQDVLVFFCRKPGMASGATIELRGARTALHVWPILAAALDAASLASIFFRFAQKRQALAPVNAATPFGIAAPMLTAVTPGRHRAQHYLLKARDQLLIFLTGLALPMQLVGSGSILVDIWLATPGQPEQR